MTSDRKQIEFNSEKCEEIAGFRLFLRIFWAKSLGRLFYQNSLPNVAEAVGFEPTVPVKGLPDFESGPL